MATKLSVVILLIAYLINTVTSSAVLQIKLRSYHVNGRDAYDRSCDYWISWWPACEPKFKFCIDDVEGDPKSVDSCSLATYPMTEYYDGNEITFPEYGLLSGNVASNPLKVKIPIYNGFRFKARVVDDDESYDDLIDEISYAHRSEPSKRAKVAEWEAVSVTGTRFKNPSRLLFDVKLYCEEDYYGPKCDKFCHPADNAKGHYTCDQDTGDILCRSGWEAPDENCLIKENNCIKDPCKNGGRCVDLYKGYICTCPTGFTGKNCGILEKSVVSAIVGVIGGESEEDVDEDEEGRAEVEEEEEETPQEPEATCYNHRCRNGGTCVRGLDGPVCICESDHHGTYCEHRAADNRVQRPTVTCYNGGRPETHNGQVRCRCPQRFVGLSCDVDRCALCSCNNHSFCPNYRAPRQPDPYRAPRESDPRESHSYRKSVYQRRAAGYNYS